MKSNINLVLCVCLLCGACSVRQAAYTTGGAAIGAGVGYSHDHNDKEAAIGGAAGALAGGILGTIEENNSRKKYKTGYEEGYNRAKVDIAQEYWQEKTEGISSDGAKAPRLRSFKVPAQSQDGVVYEAHEVVLEDYK